jgi:hypothetical protein
MIPTPAPVINTEPARSLLQQEEWPLSSADTVLLHLVAGIQNSDPEIRSKSRSLYEQAVAQLAEKLIESPSAFESAYDPSAPNVDTWFPTARLLYATARSTPVGANFRFSDTWLDQLAKNTLSWEGRIFSVCDNTVPRLLKLRWLANVLDQVTDHTPARQDLTLQLDFLTEPAIVDDPACQKMLALWFARIAIFPKVSSSYRREILSLLPSPDEEPWRRPRDILQVHFPEAIPHFNSRKFLDSSILDNYAMAVGSSAFHENHVASQPSFNGSFAWLVTHNWLAENAVADMRLLRTSIDYNKQTEAASAWVWGLEKIAENVKLRPGVFEAAHGVDHASGVYSALSVASALMLCDATKAETPLRFDVAWMTSMGDSLISDDDDTRTLFGMADDRVPLDTRLSWLKQSLKFISDELIFHNVDYGDGCQFFSQSTDCAGPYQEMIGLWLSMLAAHRDMNFLRMMDIALYSVNDMHAATLSPEDLLQRYSPKSLSYWPVIRTLDLGFEEAWLMVTEGARNTPEATLPALG